ncbi:MAG TPA: hypothetical protein VE593_08225 [Nitrososphaeraceae archaeon]|nr:hypothetical protein [Nitrososphaeraceae archaeon]
MLCTSFQGGNNERLLGMITRAVDKELFDRRIMMIHACHCDAIVTCHHHHHPQLPGSHIPQPLLPSLQLLTPISSLLFPLEDPSDFII